MKENKSDGRLPTFVAGIVFATMIVLFSLAYVNFITLPAGLKRSDEASNQGKFIAERAYEHLIELTKNGPRVAGGQSTEIHAVRYLEKIAQEIILNKNAAQTIEYDIQVAEGNYYLEESIGTTSVYQGLQNVVIKLSPSGVPEPEHSLLLNAHFDSVPTSPGAGDDGSMTVNMLEMLRVLSESSETFKHNIVFLFNGCEENQLQGAHAFITSHKWADKVRAFINMDAAANSGREIMFQAGPNHPWLMNYYRKTAPRPFSSAMGEELFQADLVPSDTDFRQLRDFGKIPGMDFAYSTNGYLYHTRYDALKTIQLESLQHTGENILPLIKALANAKEMENTKEHEDGKVIFFDFMNWFMVYYTQTEAIIINTIISCAAIFSISLSVYIMGRKSNASYKELSIEFGISFAIQFFSIILAAGVVIVLCVIFDASGRSMGWFTSQWLVFGIFFCPFFCALGLGPVLYIKFRKITKISLQHRTQMHLHSVSLVYAILLITLTGLGIRSGFLIMVTLFFYTITNLANSISKLQNLGNYWTIIHMIGQLMPFMFYSSLTLTAFGTFMAMMGRNGPTANPDLMIGVFSILMGLLMTGFIVPLISLCRYPLIILSTIFGIAIIFFIMLATPLGFPYKAEISPQRFMVQHTDRVFYNLDGTVRKSDSGYFLHPQDRHYSDYLDEFLPKESLISNVEECQNEFYCGMPFYFNVHYHSSNYSYWLPATKPVLPKEVSLVLNFKVAIEPTKTRYFFTAFGPDHMGLFIAPVLGADIVSWSYSEEMPHTGSQWKGRDVHFVAFYYGSFDDTGFDFSFDIQTDLIGGPSFDISLYGHYMTSPNGEVFNEFLGTFPEWSVVYNWMSSYKSYVF